MTQGQETFPEALERKEKNKNLHAVFDAHGSAFSVIKKEKEKGNDKDDRTQKKQWEQQQ
jgi:hypothetical protein